jgi:tRNA dimethylallyltransferase
MINKGLLAEAKELFPNKDLNALQTVGYRELFRYFVGEISLEFAIEEIKKNTRRFAKRQLTWFKRNEGTMWFDYLANQNEVTDYIKAIIHNS